MFVAGLEIAKARPPVAISRPQQSAKIGETTLEKGPAQVHTSK